MHGGTGASTKAPGLFPLLDWRRAPGENSELMVRHRCDVNVLDEKSSIRSRMGEERAVSGRNLEPMVVERDSHVHDPQVRLAALWEKVMTICQA